MNVRGPKHCNDCYLFKMTEQSLSNHSVCESHFGFHGPLSVLQALCLTPSPTSLRAVQESWGPEVGQFRFGHRGQRELESSHLAPALQKHLVEEEIVS